MNGTILIIVGIMSTIFGIILLLKNNTKNNLAEEKETSEVEQKSEQPVGDIDNWTAFISQQVTIDTENTVDNKNASHTIDTTVDAVQLLFRPVDSINTVDNIDSKNAVVTVDSINTVDSTEKLQDLIDIAVADGIVTDNEREMILNKAIMLGIDTNVAEQLLYERLKIKSSNPETKLIDKDKEKGDMFEAFIASKFDKQLFTIIEWTDDKYVKGVYAQRTLQPDLRINFKLRDITQDFAIECKYRTDFYQNGVNWAKEKQLINYKEYETVNKIPVFVAIGVGNKPDLPKYLYVIPLKDIEHTFLSMTFLNKYRINKIDRNFFFDYKNLNLR